MLVLKVFSGNQFGAEIELTPNEITTIGNDYNCDVYIDSFTKSIQDCKFIINDTNQISFTYLNCKLKLHTDELVEATKTYALPCFINFDGVFIAFGDKEAITSWPSIESVNQNVVDNEVIDIITNTDARDQKDNVMVDNFKKLRDKLKHVNSEYINPYITKYVNICYQYLKKQFIYLHKIYPKYLYGAVAVILIFSVVSYFGIVGFLNSNQLAKQMVLKDKKVIAFKKSFNELPTKYTNLNLQSVDNGYLLCGVVKSNDDIIKIKQYFVKYDGLLKYNLFTTQDAINKIKNVLVDANINNLKIKFDNDTQNLNVYGIAISGIGLVNDAQIKLDNYLPCVSNIDFSHIYDIKQIRQDLQDLTKNTSSYLEVKENLSQGEIIISGYLTNVQSSNLSSNLAKLQEKYQDVLLIKSDIKDALKALPITIDAVFTGDAPYVVTEDNQYIYLGGEVGGFKLYSITSTKIVFTGKFNIEIPLDAITGSGGTLNNSNNISTHEEVLNNEFNNLAQAIESEQLQIQNISKYRAKIRDPNLEQFLAGQIDSLKQDILTKQHELSLYKGG